MDKTKNYLDLSKCTEEERRIVRNTLYKNREYVPFFTNLFDIDRYYKLHYDEGDWLCGDVMFNEKTELQYPEFIKLFEGGESKEVLKVENNGSAVDFFEPYELEFIDFLLNKDFEENNKDFSYGKIKKVKIIMNKIKRLRLR